METKQNCFGIRNSSFQTKKIFFRFLDPKKKNVFRFLDPKKKKIFLDSSTQRKKKYFQIPATQTRHFHDQILAVIFSWSIVSSAGRLFRRQKIGQVHETKKIFFRFLDPNKKKIF